MASRCPAARSAPSCGVSAIEDAGVSAGWHLGLFGRVLRDVVLLEVQAVILVITVVLFGLRAPLDGVLLGLLLVAVVGVTMASVSYGVALLLLSGIMLPMSMGPDWLYNLSRISPLLHRRQRPGDLPSAATSPVRTSGSVPASWSSWRRSASPSAPGSSGARPPEPAEPAEPARLDLVEHRICRRGQGKIGSTRSAYAESYAN